MVFRLPAFPDAVAAVAGARRAGFSYPGPRGAAAVIVQLPVAEAKDRQEPGAPGRGTPSWATDHAAGGQVTLIEAGAVPADVGQGDVSWTVLADPEGSEFCVLSPGKPR